MTDLKLKDLRYLVAVADTRHFGRAAAKCFVSQPTLSAQLKKLEQTLGVQLIERTPNNISLTQAGEEIVARARRIEKFLSQPMYVAAQFTGLEGKYVKIEDTVRSFKEIVEGKYDEIPEQAFYMVGTIDEVLEKAEKMKAGV